MFPNDIKALGDVRGGVIVGRDFTTVALVGTVIVVMDYYSAHISGRGDMAKHPKYEVERTKIGLQYVIPGAERVRSVTRLPVKYAADGAQFVLPGAEQITTRELVARKMAEPIRPRTRQRGLAGTALFGGR